MKQKMTSREIAVTALLMALSVVAMVISSLIPGMSLILYFVCAVFVCVLALQKKMLLAVLLVVGTTFLGIILMPNKIQIIPYILFFGHYGIWKVPMEHRIQHFIPQLALKLVFYNVAVVAGYFFARDVLLGDLVTRWPLYALWLGAQVVFVLYDVAFSSFLHIYVKRIEPYIFKGQ